MFGFPSGHPQGPPTLDKLPLTLRQQRGNCEAAGDDQGSEREQSVIFVNGAVREDQVTFKVTPVATSVHLGKSLTLLDCSFLVYDLYGTIHLKNCMVLNLPFSQVFTEP